MILPSLGQDRTGEGGGRGDGGRGGGGGGKGTKEGEDGLEENLSREAANPLRMSKSNIELGIGTTTSKCGTGVQGSTSQPTIDLHGTTTTGSEHQSNHKRSYSLANNPSPYYGKEREESFSSLFYQEILLFSLLFFFFLSKYVCVLISPISPY